MDISDKVSAVLSELSGVENVLPESLLQDDLLLDSIQMVALLVMIEEAFQITLDEVDMNPFDLTKAEDVINLVQKYIKEKKKKKDC